MRKIAQLLVVGLLLTGVSFARDRRPDNYRYGDDFRYRNDPYRDYGDRHYWDRDRDHRYRRDYRSYRSLPPGLQKKMRRGRDRPPGYGYRYDPRRDRGWRR